MCVGERVGERQRENCVFYLQWVHIHGGCLGFFLSRYSLLGLIQMSKWPLAWMKWDGSFRSYSWLAGEQLSKFLLAQNVPKLTIRKSSWVRQMPRSEGVKSEKHQKDRFPSVELCLLGWVHVRADGRPHWLCMAWGWGRAAGMERIVLLYLLWSGSFMVDKGEAQKGPGGKNCDRGSNS